MDELVQRLAQGDHPVTVGGSKPTLEEFRERIEGLKYVFLKFTDTRGGTDLGVRVDSNASDLSQTHFAQHRGNIHVEGTLTLNSVNVRCVADIEAETLMGKGHLVLLEEAHL
jgi:hypothetical protein